MSPIRSALATGYPERTPRAPRATPRRHDNVLPAGAEAATQRAETVETPPRAETA